MMEIVKKYLMANNIVKPIVLKSVEFVGDGKQKKFYAFPDMPVNGKTNSFAKISFLML